MEQLQKQYKELTFTDDFMFGKVLVNNPEICRRLLEVLLEIKIKEISFPERQKTIEILSDGKGIRLDVYVDDENGTIYFKNDSAYLMAVGSTVEKLEIKQNPEKMTYIEGDVFDANGMQVIAHYTNGTTRDVTAYVTWSTEALTMNDTDFEIQLPYVMYQNQDGIAGVDCMEPFAVLQLTVTEKTVRPGDVTEDGRIDMDDVLLLLSAINGTTLTEEQKLLADINSDHQLDMLDVSAVLQNIHQ